MAKKLGRRPLLKGEKIVQITINIKEKHLVKAQREAVIIETKYR